MTYPAAQSLISVIYNDVSSNTVSHVENLQWVIYWQNLSCRYSVVTYVVAQTLTPKICSGVSTVRTFHAGNLQRLLPVQPPLSESRDDVPTGKFSCLSRTKEVVYLPAQISCRKPAVAYLLEQSFVLKISVACLPVQPLLPEAALVSK